MTSRFTFCSLLLTSFACMSTDANAQATQNELRMLLEARTVADLNQKSESAVQALNLEDACRAELKARSLPRSCFLKLKLEKSVDLREQARLTRICRQSAAKSESRLDLNSDNHALPAECLAAVQTRIDDLQYADEDLRPEVSVNRNVGPKLE